MPPPGKLRDKNPAIKPGPGCMLPKRVVSKVQKRVPFDFNMGLRILLWKHFKLHPARWVAPDGGETGCDRIRVLHPRRAHPAIRLHPARVDKIVKEISTPETFEAFFGSCHASAR